MSLPFKSKILDGESSCILAEAQYRYFQGNKLNKKK